MLQLSVLYNSDDYAINEPGANSGIRNGRRNKVLRENVKQCHITHHSFHMIVP
jgi:hypothetical protein